MTNGSHNDGDTTSSDMKFLMEQVQMISEQVQMITDRLDQIQMAPDQQEQNLPQSGLTDQDSIPSNFSNRFGSNFLLKHFLEPDFLDDGKM